MEAQVLLGEEARATDPAVMGPQQRVLAADGTTTSRFKDLSEGIYVQIQYT